MQSLCSMRLAVDIKHPSQGIDTLKSAGFEAAMLDFGAFASIEQVMDEKYKPELRRRYYEKTLDEFGSRDVKLPVAKAPFLRQGFNSVNLKTGRDVDFSALIWRINKECIAAGERAGCVAILVQPLFFGIERGHEWQENKKYYLALAEQCQSKKTRLLLVNQCRNISGHFVRGICSDAATAAKWIDDLNAEAGFECFGFCLDVGNCNLCGLDMQHMATVLGKRLKAVILTENNGHDEARMMPFTCAGASQSAVDWLSLFRGLRECAFDGYLILEAADTVFSFSSMLRPEILKFTKSLMDYFELQIGIENRLKKYASIVLFGAGNMCRNYMKCYGQKYPPLFTCDNNSRLWGASFEGLEVKNPEALRELPPDCGVFICNIYYREIEAQLREMGIENIEYFNDEYMPSFYFDRLERDE